jgi:hypothetical protein
MPYTATKERHHEKLSGSFKCQICATEVHAWSGDHDFFDWKIDKVEAPVFGRRK